MKHIIENKLLTIASTTAIILGGLMIGENSSLAQDNTNTTPISNKTAKSWQINDVHKASVTKEKKPFSMKEVILSPEIRPERVRAYWKDNDSLVFSNAGKWMITDSNAKLEKEWKATKDKALKKIPENGKNITPSPYITRSSNKANTGAKFYAFTLDKDLNYLDTDGKIHTIAKSENDQITYGQSVSRFEFGISNGIFWSNDGLKLAFYRNDESLVTDFPLLDINTRTGSLLSIKYPMIGMDSERIKLGIYDIKSGKTVWAKVDDFGDDRYLTNISWSADNKYIFIHVLDRTQKHMHLNMYNATDGSFVRTLLKEDNEKYVEPENPLQNVKNSALYIYQTNNRDGYKNLYLLDLNGNIARIANTNADLKYIGNDGKYVYYTSAEVSPVENHLFRVKLLPKRLEKTFSSSKTIKHSKIFGKPERLTTERGWHRILMNDGCTAYVDSYSNLNVPCETSLRHANGKLVKHMLSAKNPLEEYMDCEIDFGCVKSADGKYDNYFRLIKPANFDPSKKYPVILYVYGGPHSQLVKDTWLGETRLWEMYMAQKGYLVYVQDNRGTLNRGLEFEQAIHKHCGQAEMADQMEGMKMLLSLPFVDKDRIGVHGWSYGGFMTISLLTNYPEVFKVGVAGGPVIDWKWYEIMYGERYMETMESNPEGFKQTSLINKAKDLKRDLLICQGAIDSTVVWEHSLSFVRECVKNNIQLDYFPYPCHPHNVRGKDRIHLMDKVTMYFDAKL